MASERRGPEVRRERGDHFSLDPIIIGRRGGARMNRAEGAGGGDQLD